MINGMKPENISEYLLAATEKATCGKDPGPCLVINDVLLLHPQGGGSHVVSEVKYLGLLHVLL